MQCVILAGGKGTRLGELGVDRPKNLVLVTGRPFANLQLGWLAGGGVGHVVYCIGHHGDQIVEHVGDGRAFGLSVAYCDEGAELRGTGGGLRLALDRGMLEERFFVLYGDSYLRLDLREMWARAEDAGTPATMAVYRNSGRFDTSNTWFENGRVVLYDKQPEAATAAKMHHIDYGISVFTREAIQRIPPDCSYDLSELQSELSLAGELSGFEVHERFYEVGTAEGIAQLEDYLANHAERGT